MLLGNILISILLAKRIYKNWEILEEQIYNGKHQYHRNHTYDLLVTVDLLSPLVITVTEASLHMLARNILALLWLCEVSILLSSLLHLRVIEARLIIEFAHFLLAEKIKTESHIIYI